MPQILERLIQNDESLKTGRYPSTGSRYVRNNAVDGITYEIASEDYWVTEDVTEDLTKDLEYGRLIQIFWLESDHLERRLFTCLYLILMKRRKKK
jgi:hypothetical protein